MGSAGAKAMAVLLGEADVYAHAGGQYEWDNAAPAAVAAAAGMWVSRLGGEPARLQQRRPVPAGPAHLPARVRPDGARRSPRLVTRGRFVLLVAAVAIVVGIAIVAVSVRRDGGPCTERSDPLDPGSLQHVLPGSPPPSYLTDPPTSGPHQSGRLTGGVLDEPVPAPVQVGALEAGQVLIQYPARGRDRIARSPYQ